MIQSTSLTLLLLVTLPVHSRAKLSPVNNHLNQSVIVFTDGAVAESGRGSCAVILIPLEPEVPVDRTSQVHSMLTCSLEVEIAAIALAMERAAFYYSCLLYTSPSPRD